MTPEQIDAVLPRVPAGIPALTGDLTDDEERAVAVRWLLGLYREAFPTTMEPPKTESGVYALSAAILRSVGIDPDTATRVDYHHEASGKPTLDVEVRSWGADVRHFDLVSQQWVLAESPDSPPEAPESDEMTSEVPGVRGNDSGETAALSAPWPPPYGPAPGITYWEAK